MKKNNAFFVTSTGTELGKTFLAEKIISELVFRGESIDCYKPILSGFNKKNKESSDSAKLLLACKKKATNSNIKNITPWLFKNPVAPTIAAKLEKKKISYQRLKNWCQMKKQSSNSSFILFEGAGGIMVPIEKHKTFIDLFKDISFPVILLVGSYLGTVSHTLSALDNLNKRNIKIINIVLNEGIKSSKKNFSQNLELLKSSIKDKTKIRTLSTNPGVRSQQIKLITNDIIKFFTKMA